MTFTAREKKLLYEVFDLYSKEEYKNFDLAIKHNFSEQFEEKMQKLINRRKKPWYRLIDTAIKRVAIVVAVIIIALTSTVLSVDALRNGVKNFVVETFEKFSSVFFDENGNTLCTIEKQYNPAFLPEGFVISDVYSDDVTYKVKYNDDYGNEILYIQSLVSNGFNVDNENGNVEGINNGVYVEQRDNNIKMYFWSDGEYKFALHAFGDISKEDLLKMAQIKE